jgi:hypothetical protein
MTHKRYLVFAWHLGEAGGGSRDIEGSFNTVDEAENFVTICLMIDGYDCTEIFDCDKRESIETAPQI